MDFARPDIAWWLLALPVLLGLGFMLARKHASQPGAWGIGADALAAKQSGRRKLRVFLWSAALIALVGGWAQPQGEATTRLLESRGADVIFVLDVSKSMLARDVKPDRLRRAIYEIDRLLDHLKGDRVGLVIFAGTAFLQAPLTVDAALVHNVLHHLDPHEMPYPGSNIGGGIRRALEVANTATSSNPSLVLLTDGEETTGDALAAATAAGEQGIPIFVLALGTARGEPIPSVDAQGNAAVLRDAEGQVLLSKLDEAGLRKIAAQSGGRYFRIGEGGDAGAIDQVLGRLQRDMLEKRTVTERAELYPLWILPALLLLLAGWWVVGRDY
jgi:Ca-activated chloride channel homolog